jgi:hypothetical protein
MQPPLLLLSLLATTLSLVSAHPLPLKQRDDDPDADVTVSLGPIRIGAATGVLAVRSAKPVLAGDENAIKQRESDDPSTQLRAIRRQSPDLSDIIRPVVHFPIDAWAAGEGILDKLVGKL